jgi:hypothetical protein
MQIPNEAVEAALQATFAGKTISDFNRRVWTGTVKTILEAAAPYIAAEAWDRAASSIVDEHGNQIKPTNVTNPYRSQA